MSRQDVARSIRLSETVSPFGPGAVVDILGESFMVPTGDHWPPARLLQPVICDPLAARLGVDELWAAPSQPDGEASRAPGLEFRRFPAWLFCQECRAMTRWGRSDEKGRTPECPRCEGRLVPMRFVLVCTTRSHLGDVPWPEWVHRVSASECGEKDRLRFLPSIGGSEGLASLTVQCDACKTTRSLGDLRADTLKQDGFSCRGSQPWDSGWGECGEPLDVQQRGATSLHFAEVIPAIDIPEVDGRDADLDDQLRQHAFFETIVADSTSSLATTLIAEVSKTLGRRVDEVSSRLATMSGGAPPLRDATRGLKSAEFEAFLGALKDATPVADFVTRISASSAGTTPVDDELRRVIPDVVLVDRLREVRVVRGFRRHRLDAEFVDAVPRIPQQKRWLPAVEGFGEGIFLRLAAEIVEAWARRSSVVDRVAEIRRNQKDSVLGQRLPDATPHYLLLHSFAHALMSELSFQSGYTAPSLRERIYCENDGDYGVFVYTTSSDIEGTLGGLVRQGEADLLGPVIVRAVRRAAWCGNDPVCSESPGHSIDGLNLAACHSCLLAPETSCESYNLLLDRALVSGIDDGVGLLGPLVTLTDMQMLTRSRVES
jgi:hypothetical protein